MSILSTMSAHHRRCDDLFATLENQIAAKQWPQQEVFDAFVSGVTKHFDAEENLLFQAIEDKHGGPIGPTMMMRHEHQQMRVLLQQMKDAFVAREQKTFLGLSETWMILTQQHNIKEEQILYPMMDDVLSGEAATLVTQAEQLLK